MVLEILDELAAVLQDALGDDVQVVGRWCDNPTPPTVDIYPDTPFIDDTVRGFGTVGGGLRFVVRARVTTTDPYGGQETLLRMLDPTDALSVAEALFDDQTLAGYAASVEVSQPSGFTRYPDSGIQGSHLGCDWRVTVIPAES